MKLRDIHRLTFGKTTACFWKNDGSFCEKQRVVLRETTCRFMRNNVSFCRMQWRGMNDTEKWKLKNGKIEL